MPKVLISDELSPRAVDIFRERGIDVDMRTGLKPDQLKAVIGDYDGLAIRSATKVTKDVLEVAHALKVVGRAGIGVDNVDIPAATARGVVVMNTPFGNSITTAEHAIALMFALARDIPQANASTHAGKWEKSRFMGVELTGKSLGVIGCGNIGSIVADRALGLSMKVLAYDPFLTAERATDLGVEKVELDDLLSRADFITLHTPMTDQTRGMIDAKALARTRLGVRIINCARGGLIDEAALKAAIESGHVAGAALDVFVVEPAKENPLFALDQVICTPHLGASTSEAQENVALQVAEQMADFLLQGAVINAVNMPSLSAEDAPKLRPYLASLNLRPLTAVVLKGLLSTRMETVNMVNAAVIARQRDIKVSEVRRDQASDYQTTIRVTTKGDAEERSVTGTLFGDKPRIVAIEGVPTEAELTAHMLLIENLDKPGFIGSLGRTLGDGRINIAAFHNGRTAPGARAFCLVSVDQRIDDALLKRIQTLPNVVSVRDLSF
jgi:D-3-phosphoglycerate dehydrogenase